MLRILLTLSILLSLTLSTYAQLTRQGTVLGRDTLPLAGVTVLNLRTQSIAVADDNGSYAISFQHGDTVLFRAIGYYPLAIAAERIPAILRLQTQVLDLERVEITRRDYRRDSLERREEYRQAFNFRRPRFTEMVMIVPTGMAFNIHKVYQGLSFKKNKRKERFRSRLINYEQELYIDHLFTPQLVAQYTNLEGDSLQYFMKTYRPAYQQLNNMAGYDLLFYIKQSAARYRQGSPPGSTTQEAQ